MLFTFVIELSLLLISIDNAAGDYPCTQTAALSGGITISSTNQEGDAGEEKQYRYQIWSDGTAGTLILRNVGAAYRAEWNDNGDFLARVGLHWGKPGVNYTTLGTIESEFAYTRSSAHVTDYSYIGVYGWAWADAGTGAPLAEWYIIDDWYGNQYQKTPEYQVAPFNWQTVCGAVNTTCEKGELTVDGSLYKVYHRVNKSGPTIGGSSGNFTQYWSVRQTLRSCGTITVNEHFKKWEALGMKLGKIYEAKQLLEVGGDTGWIDYTYARIRANVDGSGGGGDGEGDGEGGETPEPKPEPEPEAVVPCGKGAGESAVSQCQQCTQRTGGTVVTATNKTAAVSGSGGYTYTLWQATRGNMTVYGGAADAAFKAQWNDSGDFMARVGVKWPGTGTGAHTEYGDIVAEYAYTRSPPLTGGDYNYISVYGWLTDPLIEYYIIDDWFSNSYGTDHTAPVSNYTFCSDGTPCDTSEGTLTVDGGTYSIYKTTLTGRSIQGQKVEHARYVSVRQTTRRCGKVSVSEHFKKWAALGMPLGKLYETTLLVEAGGGIGWIDYTYATIKATNPSKAAPPRETPVYAVVLIIVGAIVVVAVAVVIGVIVVIKVRKSRRSGGEDDDTTLYGHEASTKAEANEEQRQSESESVGNNSSQAPKGETEMEDV